MINNFYGHFLYRIRFNKVSVIFKIIEKTIRQLRTNRISIQIIALLFGNIGYQKVNQLSLFRIVFYCAKIFIIKFKFSFSYSIYLNRYYKKSINQSSSLMTRYTQLVHQGSYLFFSCLSF